jgi:hypothetical protein
MSDFQDDMNRAVQGFVARISELARQAALETLGAAFGGSAPRNVRSAPVAALASTRVGRPAGGRGVKRTAEDLEALSGKVASFVKANPGLRIEQINKELGTSTKDLALPIRKLIAGRVIATKGQKRSTTYFPGKKAGKE